MSMYVVHTCSWCEPHVLGAGAPLSRATGQLARRFLSLFFLFFSSFSFCFFPAVPSSDTGAKGKRPKRTGQDKGLAGNGSQPACRISK